MKTFSEKELGGVGDKTFSGETFKEVGEQYGAYLMSTTDDEHKEAREQLASATDEQKEQWMKWFEGEWDKKTDDKA